MEASDYCMQAFYSDQKAGEKESFAVDDLLDFPNDDALITDGFFDNNATISNDSSTVSVLDSCNSSNSVGNEQPLPENFVANQFSGDAELCVPYDDLAELEWLSNFTEDSFSTEELQNLHLITGASAGVKRFTPESSETSDDTMARTMSNPVFPTETTTTKARSKRSRAAPCDWSTRLLNLPSNDNVVGNADADVVVAKTVTSSKRRESSSDGVVRKCLHCAAEKTPQWRTGPMGPKTLCNACGVRYKSGRLVPEYRPAASPTFVSTKHSNSHRKVLELRRQQELARQQQQQLHHQQPHQMISQSSIFGLSNGGGDEFLLHHHAAGADYRHMI